MATQLPHYLINLSRRSDRLARMTATLSELDLTAQRVAAVDAADTSEAALAQVVRARGPLGKLPTGDRACTASHFKAWEGFLATSAPAAVFLEDDLEFARDYAAFARDIGWMPADAEVIKFEKYSRRRSKKLLGPGVRTPRGRMLHRLYSRHTGGAAYLLTRAGAEALMALKGRADVPVDHLIFSPNVSSFARHRPIYQLNPAIVRQEDDPEHSDIAGQRQISKPLAARLRRAYFEVNYIPRQLLHMLSGGARFRLVGYSEHAGEVTT